jgi:hypothetical protein
LRFVVLNTGFAQVAVSVGVQQIYDNNIFLESTDKSTLDILSETLTPEELGSLDLRRIDGDPNDDFITFPYIGVSGPIEIFEHIKSAAELKAGVYVFANESYENRFILDSNVKVSLEETILPEPFYLDLLSTISSRSNDIPSQKEQQLDNQKHILLHLMLVYQDGSLCHAQIYRLVILLRGMIFRRVFI